MGAPTFGSSYGNGGQNALYWNNLGSGGGGGGGGYGLDAQMQAMSSFDPAAWMNIMRSDSRDLAQSRLDRQDAQGARDRAYAEQQQERARQQAAQERMRMERERQRMATAAEMQRRNSPTDALAPFNAALNSANRMDTPLDRRTTLGGYGSNFRNAPFAANLSGVQLTPNPWEALYGQVKIDPLAQDKANVLRNRSPNNPGSLQFG